MIQPIGHFKVWRALYTKPIWLKSTLEQQVILMTLIAMANFKENEWEWKGQKYTVKPGQFITSLESIRSNTGGNVSVQNVRTALSRFERLGFLTNESTKTGRIITIVNWEEYQATEEQATEEQANKGGNKDLTKTQQRGNKDLTPIEEGNKEIKKEGNIIMTPQEAEYISVLEKIENYPLDREKDLEYLKVLEERYPTLDLVEAIKKFSIWVIDNPFKKNANHRSQINTSFGKYKEWGVCTRRENQGERKQIKRGPLELVIRENY